MSKEEKYRVTSPIKMGGKRYEIGDSILLTAEQAEDLHVEPWDAAASEDASSEQPKQSPSSGLSAPAAVKTIEGNDLKDIAGFVVPAPEGTEDRKTVLKAWADKQPPAGKKDTPAKGSTDGE